MLAQGQLALLLQLFRGTETTIGFALLEQLFGVLVVNVQALALAVGRVGATDFRALAPVQAQPAEIFDQLGFVTDLTPLHIGVLDAENEVTSVVAGKEPVVKRCAGIAHVQHSGRRGSKAHPGVWHKSVLMLSSQTEPRRVRKALAEVFPSAGG